MAGGRCEAGTAVPHEVPDGAVGGQQFSVKSRILLRMTGVASGRPPAAVARRLCVCQKHLPPRIRGIWRRVHQFDSVGSGRLGRLEIGLQLSGSLQVLGRTDQGIGKQL